MIKNENQELSPNTEKTSVCIGHSIMRAIDVQDIDEISLRIMKELNADLHFTRYLFAKRSTIGVIGQRRTRETRSESIGEIKNSADPRKEKQKMDTISSIT
ncbi:uncharacterized protein EV154DRAFT_485033 [Mucor mucedo]|uniref:uncharacterized protein n=1 Tax=Mucor mucedo TaxID=29922 RepID=UPI00222020DF|nr:uncharacterized protein EV154DRAFT_485033 [Mucor mucedo]KAI7886840.1 hypothetical protein EV154DRAFT_485033 [Mucor mucedo]